MLCLSSKKRRTPMVPQDQAARSRLLELVEKQALAVREDCIFSFDQARRGEFVDPPDLDEGERLAALIPDEESTEDLETNDDELEHPAMLARFLDSLVCDDGIVVYTVSRHKRITELVAGVDCGVAMPSPPAP